MMSCCQFLEKTIEATKIVSYFSSVTYAQISACLIAIRDDRPKAYTTSRAMHTASRLLSMTTTCLLYFCANIIAVRGTGHHHTKSTLPNQT